MARTSSGANRNYPPITLRQALVMPQAIYEGASGLPVDRLTLSELLDRSPSSSAFVMLVLASRAYGLTTGGKNADEFGLTPIGRDAVGGDEVTRVAALRKAVLNVQPFNTFFAAYDKKKLPHQAPMRSFLIAKAHVPENRVEEAIKHLFEDAETASLVREIKGSKWIDLQGVPTFGGAPQEEALESDENGAASHGDSGEVYLSLTPGEMGESPPTSAPSPPTEPKKVFIAHGKNHTPLNQLKKALDQFKVRYAVAVDEANKGRPISEKVAHLMRDECSSAIFIFTADEPFLRGGEDEDQEEVWRPSENVVFELGAASVLYDKRIVIFKEKGVEFPSDFRDLGYIEFDKDQLATEIGSLFQELVALDILEVRAKA